LKIRDRVFDVIEREVPENRRNGMKPGILAQFTAALVTTALPAMAQSAWHMAPAHSAVPSQAKPLRVSDARGEFGKISGTVWFDGKNHSTAKAEAVIEVASINARVPKRDAGLQSPISLPLGIMNHASVGP